MATGRVNYCLIWGFTGTLIAAPPVIRRTPLAGSQSSQFFGRGFELNNGTDFALDFWGIPLNVPSHVRGPGFLEPALVIPELVEGFRYTKGLYQAEQGGFSVAGSASMEMAAELERPFLSVAYGGASTDRYGRILWAERIPESRITYALDILRNDRPWNDLFGSGRFNGLLQTDGEGPRGRWSFTVLGSEDRSDGGAAAPVGGGPDGATRTVADAKAGDGTWNQRLFLAWRLAREDGRGGSARIQLFGGAQHDRIWNNWTYFLRDTENGDQLEQVDRRMFLGAEYARTWSRSVGTVTWIHTLGAQARADRVTAAEVAATADRVRIGPSSPIPSLSSGADLVHGALYGQTTLQWAEGWEGFLGFRLDAQSNRAHDVAGAWTPQDRGQVLGSPKGGLSFSPAVGTKFTLQAGQGFRLGDAWRESQPMVRARSAEVSAQTRPLGTWTTCVTAWGLDLESESLFDPSQNAFKAWGPARHTGIEFYNEIKRAPWRVELAWGWNRGALKDPPAGQDHVPGFVPQTGFLGAGWKDRGLAVEVKWRRTGVRPLTPDGAFQADRQDAVELKVQQDFGPWSLALEVLNAFSRKIYNQEYYYLSRFPDADVKGAMGRNIKAADPQTIRVEVRRRF